MCKCGWFVLGAGILCVACGLALGQDGDVDVGSPPEFYGEFPKAVYPIEPEEKALQVDTSNRAAIVDFFNTVYEGSNGVEASWNGTLSSCDAGTTSAAYADATIQRVNYFRAMAGLPADVTLDSTLNSKCQEAALMMIANGALSHTPPNSWTCYTADGAEAAGKSNIAIGMSGPDAIDGYMDDAGTASLGHRRWIVYPRQQVMGTGSVTASNGAYHGANALWAIDGGWGTTSQPVSWPPKGYVPYQVVYADWSYAYPSADFSEATVTMQHGTSPVSLTVVSLPNGYGDNAIAWTPDGIVSGPSATDETYTVTIQNILIGGIPHNETYDVTIIDPSRTGAEGEGETPSGGCFGGAVDDTSRGGPFTKHGGDVLFVMLAAITIALVRRRKTQRCSVRLRGS